MVTGSDQAVFLQLPVSGTAANTFGARDMGKIITIKKSGHVSDTVDLVLTGSPAVHDNGLFEQGLSAITMSAPHAAINLMWNGSSYEIFQYLLENKLYKNRYCKGDTSVSPLFYAKLLIEQRVS